MLKVGVLGAGHLGKIHLRLLQQSEKYQELFYKAFGTKNITGQLTLKSISQFVVSLTTSNSKYDKVVRKEVKFTKMEQKGYDLFKKYCNKKEGKSPSLI